MAELRRMDSPRNASSSERCRLSASMESAAMTLCSNVWSSSARPVSASLNECS